MEKVSLGPAAKCLLCQAKKVGLIQKAVGSHSRFQAGEQSQHFPDFLMPVNHQGLVHMAILIQWD